MSSSAAVLSVVRDNCGRPLSVGRLIEPVVSNFRWQSYKVHLF